MSVPTAIIERMFDDAVGQSPGGATSSPSAAAVVTQWTSALQDGTRPVEDAGRIDLLRALEDLKNAAAAAQADAARDLDASQKALQAAAGDPVRQRGRGVAAQIALARRDSHHCGTQHLGLASVLHEMPQAASAFRRGRVGEWRMQLLLRETACLSAEHRLAVDEELASDPARLEAMGERELVKAAMTSPPGWTPQPWRRGVAGRRRTAG